MPPPRHFLLLLVQVVWPIHQRWTCTINPCSLQASTNSMLAAQRHFTPVGKPKSMTEQVLSKQHAWCCDSTAQQTMPGMHTGDNSKAKPAQILCMQLRSLFCHSLGLQKDTTHQLVASTASTQARQEGRCLQTCFPVADGGIPPSRL